MSNLFWHPEKFIKEVEDKQAKRIEKAAIFLENQCKVELSVKAPPHSAAGDYPHLVTGELRRSITHEMDKSTMTARVGTNKIYARYLWKGTRFIEPRKMMDAVLEANHGAIKAILEG